MYQLLRAAIYQRMSTEGCEKLDREKVNLFFSPSLVNAAVNIEDAAEIVTGVLFHLWCKFSHFFIEIDRCILPEIILAHSYYCRLPFCIISLRENQHVDCRVGDHRVEW